MVTKYGFGDQYSLEHSGKFVCTDTGLYLIVVNIMSKGSDSSFYIRRNEHDLTITQISSKHSDNDINMWHSGTGSIVIKLLQHDVIYVLTTRVNNTHGEYSCLTIVRQN